MGLFDSLLHGIGLDSLWNFVLQKFPALGKLFDLAKNIIGHFTGTFGAAVDLFKSAESEFFAWRSFKTDIRFRQRVIQVERAIAKAKELIDGVVAAWKSILHLIKRGGLELETGGAAEIAEAASGIGLPVAIVNAIVLVIEVLDTVRNVIDTAQSIVNAIGDARQLFEGDLIFLSQKNPRRSEKLADGSTIKIRVGKLHHS